MDKIISWLNMVYTAIVCFVQPTTIGCSDCAYCKPVAIGAAVVGGLFAILLFGKELLLAAIVGGVAYAIYGWYTGEGLFGFLKSDT